MKALNIERGIAAPYLAANVDTDVIMPKQFLKRIDREGLAEGVFFDQRFLGDGQPNPAFILNKPAWREASFLVVGDNFGCGSSRVYAVWGLLQLNIKAIIGTSFAGIFFDNCQRNGILLITILPKERDRLGNVISNPEHHHIEINLSEQKITYNQNEVISFEMDPLRKESLLKGVDIIDSTLEKRHLINEFEQHYLSLYPWLDG